MFEKQSLEGLDRDYDKARKIQNKKRNSEERKRERVERKGGQ